MRNLSFSQGLTNTSAFVQLCPRHRQSPAHHTVHSRPIKMHDLKILQSGVYKKEGLTRLKLTAPLDSFPLAILGLGQTLEQLDLSGTGLSSLPPSFGQSLPNLKIAFFSQCAFKTFPQELASCPQLEMIAFRGNGMVSIPEDAFPPRLRWLILTDNKLGSLPSSIGRCGSLQKCMLAGNQLHSLPSDMRHCRKLGLLRLSSNRLQSLPDWLLDMPELAFLSFAGNPCSNPSQPKTKLQDVPWSSLEFQHTLGEGASGIISRGLWHVDSSTTQEVAIKMFKGALTSDGRPEDEMAACIAAGQHKNIINVLSRIHGYPEEATSIFKGGLVMELIPPHYRTLGQPPSLQTCTRDTYSADTNLSLKSALNILAGIAAAAAHLHAHGISHGDLYAHNILTSEDGHALLGDFGAATVHGCNVSSKVEQLDVLAFAHLIEDVLGLLPSSANGNVAQNLKNLHRQCATRSVGARPCFGAIVQELGSITMKRRPSMASQSRQLGVMKDIDVQA